MLQEAQAYRQRVSMPNDTYHYPDFRFNDESFQDGYSRRYRWHCGLHSRCECRQHSLRCGNAEFSDALMTLPSHSSQHSFSKDQHVHARPEKAIERLFRLADDWLVLVERRV